MGSLCGVCFKVGIVVAFGVHLNVSLELLMHPISVARPTLLEFPVSASELVLWGPVIWIPGSPPEKDCYLRAALRSQTENPNQQ